MDKALEWGHFSHVYISTDIPALIEQYKDHPKVSVRERPPEMATDDAVMTDVVLDCISYFKIPNQDFIWLLQPTSPFRLKEDFDSILRMVMRLDVGSIISVKEVGASHPNRMYTIKQNRLYPLRFTNFDNKQNLIKAFIRNGCFYVSNCQEFRTRKSFQIEPCVPYLMPEERSVNIDGPLDLKLAQVVHGKS